MKNYTTLLLLGLVVATHLGITLQAMDTTKPTHSSKDVHKKKKIESKKHTPKDKFHISPLHRAICRNDAYEVIKLIDSGADIHAKDFFKVTPLHYATCTNQAQMLSQQNYWLNKEAIIHFLIEAGADHTAQSWDGKTPLDDAREHDSSGKIHQFMLDAIQDAIE